MSPPINAYDEAVQALDDKQAVEPVNPFDRVVSQVYGGDESTLRVAGQVAAPITPDRAAEAVTLGKRVGLPADLVLKNFDVVKQRVQQEDPTYGQVVQQSPAVASFLQSPVHAAIAKDDLPALTTFERLLQVGRNVAGAAGAGLIESAAGAYGVAEAGAEAVGATDVATHSAEKARYFTELAATARGPQTDVGFTEKAIYGGIEGLGNMIPALIAGAVSGGVSLLATLGLTAAGQTYAEARQQGQTIGKAQAAGSIQGAIMVATDFVPAHRLLGDLAAKSGLVTTLAHQLVPSIAGFEVATVLQDLNAWAFLPANQDRTFADYLKERPSQAAAALVSAITATGATSVVAHGTAHLIAKLGETAAESKTVQRSPETAQTLLASAAKDSAVETSYTPIAAFTEYFQSKGLDPAVVAQALTGSDTAYRRAVATGEDLAIPTAKLIVDPAFQEHNAFFQQEVKFSPETMNAREAGEFQQAARAQATNPQAVEQPNTDPIRERIVSQLEAAGFERSTAETHASLYEAAFGTLGQRAGVDPNELFQRYGLQIQRAGLDSSAGQAQTAGDVTAVRSAGPGTGREGRPAARGLSPSEQGAVYPDARARQHFSHVLDDLTERARQLDPSVTAEDLRPEFESRLVLLRDMQQAVKDGGKDPLDLLRTVAASGGLFEDEAGQAGELRTLKDGLKFGRAQGVANVFRAKREVGGNGSTVRGLSLDEMATRLRQDPRFAWVENGQMLWDALDDAIRHPLESDLPTLKELQQTLGMSPDRAWWKSEPASDAVDTGGDTSFDPTSFSQGVKPGEFFLEMAQRIGATKDTAARLAAPGEPVELRRPGGRSALAGPDMSKPGAFRLTRFEDGAPIGHTEYQTLEAAVLSGLQDGYTGEVQPRLPEAGAVRDREIATPEFDAPFSLTSEAAKGSKGNQGSLFQGERGRITFGNQQTKIDLFQGADLSTVLHESAHLFFQVMRDLAPQSEQIAADLKTIEAAYGTEHVSQHEGFATAFEKYLMEGKAPSAELRPVFARFRAWLVGVYRSLTGLKVDVAPEVRQVFDRLLASDAAIAQAEADGHVQALFTDAKSAGMTDTEFEKYRSTVEEASQKARADLEQQALVAVQRERQAWWNTEREQTRETVVRDLRQQPVYQALDAIKSGLGEGVSREPLKLSKASLEHYNAETLTALRKHDAYRVEGGVDVETAAQMLGFSSGDDLVQALKTAPTFKLAVEAETDRRMQQAHGDVVLDGRFAEAAQQAVFSHRDQVVQAELKALTKGMVKGTIPPASVLRSIAEQRIGSTKVRDLKPGLFLMAVQRASQRAFDLKESDRSAAVSAKQQELVNLALYRQALAAKDFADAARTYLGPYFDKASTRERIGKAGHDYLDQIDGLRDRYDFAKVTNKTLDHRAALADFVQSQQAAGHELAIDPAVLNEARRTNYRDLTVDQLRGVHDAVQSIEHWARWDNKLLRQASQLTLEEMGRAGSAAIAAHAAGQTIAPLEPRLPGAEGKRQVNAFLLAHRPLLAILRQFDGYTNGFFFDHIWRPAHEARNAEQVTGQAAATTWAAIHDARFTGRETELYRPLPIPEIHGSLTLAARLAVALNYGNEGNRERLRSAGIGNTKGLSDPQIHAILDTLTAEDWQYVKDVAAHIGSYKPAIGALYKRVTGVEPTWVEPTPFQTKFGEMPGWYYPIAYEGRASARALPGPEASFADILGKSSYLKFQTANGHTEARVQHTGIPLRADLGVIGEHLQQVIHDLTHREMLIDVGRIMGRKDLQDAIYTHYGDQYYKQIQGEFRELAIGTLPAPDWYRTIEPLRRGAAMARLAWNFATIVRHVTNLTNGMVQVGYGDVLKAIPRWLGSPRDAENSAGWISANSDLMNNRWSHRLEELASIKSDIGLNRGKWAATVRDAAVSVGIDPNLTHRFSDSYLYGIHKVIQMAEIPTWIAEYQHGLAETPEDQARAVGRADAAVLNAFGGGDLLDRAGVQNSYGGKLFTTFATFSLTLNRMNYEVFHRDTSVGRKIMDATLLNIVPVMLVGSIFNQVHKRDSWSWEIAQELFAQSLGMVVFLRELSGALSHRDYAGPASLSPFGTATRIIYDTAAGLRDDHDKSQTKKLERAGKSAAELAGQFYGVPVYQVEKTAAGIQDLMNGKGNLSEVFMGPPPKGAK